MTDATLLISPEEVARENPKGVVAVPGAKQPPTLQHSLHRKVNILKSTPKNILNVLGSI